MLMNSKKIHLVMELKVSFNPINVQAQGILKVLTEKYEKIWSNHDHGKSLIDRLQNDSFEFLTFVDITASNTVRCRYVAAWTESWDSF